ncbi:MAG: lmo0937 family membrane protein [Gemmatimonadota bacterium]
MLWTIAIILLVLWALGFFVANLGAIVHLLLVIALVAIIWNFVAGRGARAV